MDDLRSLASIVRAESNRDLPMLTLAPVDPSALTKMKLCYQTHEMHRLEYLKDTVTPSVSELSKQLTPLNV